MDGAAALDGGAAHHLDCLREPISGALASDFTNFQPRSPAVGSPLTDIEKFSLRAAISGRVLAAIFLGLHVLVGALIWFTPTIHRRVSNSDVVAESGLAYLAPLDVGERSFYSVLFDASNSPVRSKLTLFENGVPLGPAHSLHQEIRQRGLGRYSHWGNSVIFSTSDRSDPRSNGRTYAIETPTVVKWQFKLPAWLVLLLADAIFVGFFRKEVVTFLKRRSTTLARSVLLGALVLTALTAFGVFGPLAIANGNLPGDTPLVVSALAHACLGCLLSIGMWAVGAGVTRFALRKDASLTDLLIPAFPVGLLALTILVATIFLVPHGGFIACVLAIACMLPLATWRPPRWELANSLATVLGILPFAIAFGVWLALLWHGPTPSLSGTPSGDLTYYVGLAWSFAREPYPLIDLGYANAPPLPYFNFLLPAICAVFLKIPGFDPFLFMLAASGTSYVLLTTVMVHLYFRDRRPKPLKGLSALVFLLALIVAARYPYWVAESPPVTFVPALTISVWRMSQQGERAIGAAFAAMLAALTGSILSKVGTAAVLVPLGSIALWNRFWRLHLAVRISAIAVSTVSGVYVAVMLLHFLPLYIKIAEFGPESLRMNAWWFQCRDLGCLLLMILCWCVADIPVAVVLSVGFISFLAYSFLFQINFVCSIVLLGIVVADDDAKTAFMRPIALIGFGLCLPAALLSDPAGTSSGFIWMICLGGAGLLAIRGSVQPGIEFLIPKPRVGMSAAMMMIVGVGLIGVARGSIIMSSGWDRFYSRLTPQLRDVWSMVRQITPEDALIFTDQVNERQDLLGGWNTYAFSGQRQLFLSSYSTNFRLRADQKALREILVTNENVLNGAESPETVPTRSRYKNFFAVVSTGRSVPSRWERLYDNRRYAIFKIVP
jgi:hypothetical protein